MIRVIATLGLCLALVYSVPECGPHEELTDSGFDCMTCQNRFFVRCAHNKERKCRCRDGFIRSDEKSCISMDECLLHDECRSNKGPYAKYYRVNISCPKSCPGQAETTCMNLSGCGCKNGYLWDSSSQTCVYPSECKHTK